MSRRIRGNIKETFHLEERFGSLRSGILGCEIARRTTIESPRAPSLTSKEGQEFAPALLVCCLAQLVILSDAPVERNPIAGFSRLPPPKCSCPCRLGDSGA